MKNYSQEFVDDLHEFYSTLFEENQSRLSHFEHLLEDFKTYVKACENNDSGECSPLNICTEVINKLAVAGVLISKPEFLDRTFEYLPGTNDPAKCFTYKINKNKAEPNIYIEVITVNEVEEVKPSNLDKPLNAIRALLNFTHDSEKKIANAQIAEDDITVLCFCSNGHISHLLNQLEDFSDFYLYRDHRPDQFQDIEAHLAGNYEPFENTIHDFAFLERHLSHVDPDCFVYPVQGPLSSMVELL